VIGKKAEWAHAAQSFWGTASAHAKLRVAPLFLLLSRRGFETARPLRHALARPEWAP